MSYSTSQQPPPIPEPPRVSHFQFKGSLPPSALRPKIYPPQPLLQPPPQSPPQPPPPQSPPQPLFRQLQEFPATLLLARDSHQGPFNPLPIVDPSTIPRAMREESEVNVRDEESRSFKKHKDKDEESKRPISASDYSASKDVEDRRKTEKTPVKEPAAEDVGIPTTPGRQMKSIAPPLDNLFASPDPKQSKTFGEALDEGVAGSPIASSAIAPPTIQLRKQNLNGTFRGAEKQSMTLTAYQNTLETGAKGCELYQIQTVLKSRFEDNQAFRDMVVENPSLISIDAKFFHALRDVYLGKMCSFWRRAFSLKTLRGIRLLSFTPNSRPTIVPFDVFVLQEIFYAYQNPSSITTEHDWIDWVFRLRQPGRRHTLEFVEGWNGTRIAIAGSIPLLLSTVLGIVWSVYGSGIPDAFSIASFILTAGSLLLALLAIISGIESSGHSIAPIK